VSMNKVQAGELQAALKAKGYNLGTTGPKRDGVDQDYGPTTHGALLRAVASSPMLSAAAPATGLPPIPADVFTAAETKKLAVLHPDLRRVLARARVNGARFRIDTVERSLAAQKAAVASGNSQTMDSRHLPSRVTQLVHAVDLYPLDDVDHDNVPWDWDDFYPLAEQIRAAADQEKVQVRWGGCWKVITGTTQSAKAMVAAYSAERRALGRKPLLDGPHFELPAATYP
jgi:peptidoglycan L-alanyl-D-glutamate endopeptidase CwlK